VIFTQKKRLSFVALVPFQEFHIVGISDCCPWLMSLSVDDISTLVVVVVMVFSSYYLFFPLTYVSVCQTKLATVSFLSLHNF